MTTAGDRKLLAGIVQRATCLVDDESAMLREASAADHGPCVVKKNTIAFELENVARMVEAIVPDEDLRHRLRILRDKLEENRELLQIHVSASREIVNILSALQVAADSDGTYFVSPARSGRVT